MKNAPNIIKLENLYSSTDCSQACIDGKWVPARPCGFYSIGNRAKAAWLVFTGKADALLWPGQ
jgi:hypothetical protein